MADEVTPRRSVGSVLTALPLTGVVMLLLVAWAAALSGSQAGEAVIEVCSGTAAPAGSNDEPCRRRAETLAMVDDGNDGDVSVPDAVVEASPVQTPGPAGTNASAAEAEPVDPAVPGDGAAGSRSDVPDAASQHETEAADTNRSDGAVPSTTPTDGPNPTPTASQSSAAPSATATPARPTPTPTAGATPTRSELGTTPTATPTTTATPVATPPATATPAVAVPPATATTVAATPRATPTAALPLPTATTVATPTAAPPTATASPSPTATPSPTVTPAGPQPVGRPGAWTLIFEDDFTYLDEQIWETAWFSSFDYTPPVNSGGGACYHPNQVSVVGGDLQLRIDPIDDPRCLRKDGVTRADYVAGLVNTRDSFTFSYGYAEARVFLPSAAGSLDNWAAFWHTGFDWPRTGEVDIVEGLSGGQPCSVYHWAGAGGEHLQTKACVNWPEPGGWHVFAADWQPGRITFYYDGVEVFSTTEGVTGDPHYLILNYTVRANGEGTSVPSTMAVDYVRVWQN